MCRTVLIVDDERDARDALGQTIELADMVALRVGTDSFCWIMRAWLKRALDRGDAAARMIYGVSSQSEALRMRVRAVARANAEMLISDEPGTGTPKIAEVIHLLSGAAQRLCQTSRRAAVG